MTKDKTGPGHKPACSRAKRGVGGEGSSQTTFLDLFCIARKFGHLS